MVLVARLQNLGEHLELIPRWPPFGNHDVIPSHVISSTVIRSKNYGTEGIPQPEDQKGPGLDKINTL